MSTPSEQPQVIYVRAGNGMAVAALVCGIVGMLAGLIPILFFISLPLGILAVIFGYVGRKRAKKEPEVGRKGMATAGLVTGILAVVLGIVGVAIVDDATDDLGQDLDEIEREFNQDIDQAERQFNRDLNQSGQGVTP